MLSTPFLSSRNQPNASRSFSSSHPILYQFALSFSSSTFSPSLFPSFAHAVCFRYICICIHIRVYRLLAWPLCFNNTVYIGTQSIDLFARWPSVSPRLASFSFVYTISYSCVRSTNLYI